MIITQTPYRISLFGGGSDYPAWYLNHGGRVLSFSINKYCYVSVRQLPPFFKHKIRVSYSKVETVDHYSQIQHPAVREALRLYAPNKGLEIQHHGDLPAQSGVGSSSAFAVGLLNGVQRLNGSKLENSELAQLAIDFEQNELRENVGSQDQIACALGGINTIDFERNGKWTAKKPNLSEPQIDNINKYLYAVFTGVPRLSSDVSVQLVDSIKSHNKLMDRNVELVEEALKIFKSESDFSGIGELLNEGWAIKKALNPASVNPPLENIWLQGLKAGATGGKVLGAGGGGFLLFWVPPQNRAKFENEFTMGVHVPVRISHGGARVLLDEDAVEY